MIAYGVGFNRTRLPQDLHRRLQVRLECRPNRQSDIAEARKNRDLDITVQHVTSQVLQQHRHKVGRILCTLVAKGARDVADNTNSDSAKLGILVCFESGVEVGQECLDVGCKVGFQS